MTSPRPVWVALAGCMPVPLESLRGGIPEDVVAWTREGETEWCRDVSLLECMRKTPVVKKRTNNRRKGVAP
jgi:hypothetical protein